MPALADAKVVTTLHYQTEQDRQEERLPNNHGYGRSAATLLDASGTWISARYCCTSYCCIEYLMCKEALLCSASFVQIS